MDPSEIWHSKDLRSPSIPRKRTLKAKQKYLSYRSHHPSTVGQKYLALTEERPREKGLGWLQSVIPWEDNVCEKAWTKQDLWANRLDDIWPLRHPHHYGRCRGCHTERPGGWRSRKEEREALRKGVEGEVEDAMFKWRCTCGCEEIEAALEFPHEESEYTSYGVVDSRQFHDGEDDVACMSAAESDLAQDLGFDLVSLPDTDESDSDEWLLLDSPDGIT